MSAGPTENEIKLRVADVQAARAALVRLRATLAAPRQLEDNLLLDDARGSLAAAGTLLRLRRTPAGARLTFKGPRLVEDGVKAREEMELGVSDADAAQSLLERLGYRARFRYQKYREAWRHGEVEVVVDETPIGCFLEIEGPPAAIHAAAAALGYGPGDYITDSYAALFFAAGGTGDMLFR